MANIFKLVRFVKPYWKRSLVSLILLIAVVLMDLAIPRLIQRIIDQGIAAKDLSVVVNTTLIMLGISVVSAVFAIGNNILSVQVGESVARDLRESLFRQIQAFSFSNLDHYNTGQLMVRLSSDASVFQRLVQVSLRIGTRAPMLMTGSLILMFSTNSRLAWMIMPILAATMVVIVFFVSRMGKLFRVLQQKLDRLNIVLQENIAGARLVKAFVRADFEGERFASANEQFTDHNIHVMQFLASLWPAMSVFINLGLVVVIWSGGMQSIRGEISVGQIVAFINYLQTTLGPLGIMVMLANVVAAGTASAERINEILDTIPDVQDIPDPLPLPVTRRPRIEFSEVSFCYDHGTDGLVLDDINLSVESGKTIAILGATGAGKSSLVNLVPRFYDATAGKVAVEGVDIRQVRRNELLEWIGVVPQESVLFTGSVRDNIRYGRPQAGDDEVIAAAKAAQAHDFILDLPKGYDTHVEERGVNLSGGQKQRIAIARALLLHPSVLILDDSTSSVDVETEKRIQEALKEWMRDRTILVVAQRISTVLHANKIVVLDQGKIIAEGTHSELMQSSPVYQEIYASQLGAGIGLESETGGGR